MFIDYEGARITSAGVALQTVDPGFIWDMPYTRRTIQARIAMSPLKRYQLSLRRYRNGGVDGQLTTIY